MNDIPVHNYSQYANKILSWVGTDQYRRFNEIKADPSKYQMWIDSGWNSTIKIEYKFNEHGFRTDNFDQSQRIAVFGSSQTVGVGLRQDQTWVYLVAKTLNVPVWNLATGTGSLDTCYRIIKYYVQHLNITTIILAIPEDNKFELWNNGLVLVNGTNQTSKELQTI